MENLVTPQFTCLSPAEKMSISDLQDSVWIVCTDIYVSTNVFCMSFHFQRVRFRMSFPRVLWSAVKVLVPTRFLLLEQLNIDCVRFGGRGTWTSNNAVCWTLYPSPLNRALSGSFNVELMAREGRVRMLNTHTRTTLRSWVKGICSVRVRRLYPTQRNGEGLVSYCAHTSVWCCF